MNDQKPLSDPTYNFQDFRAQLLGGSLRWVSSVLMFLSLGFLLFMWWDPSSRDIHLLIPLKGNAALGVIGFAFIFWLLIAVVSWNSWLKRSK